MTVFGVGGVAAILLQRIIGDRVVRRITEEGWGPLELWRELQATGARQHQANGIAREGAM